MVETDPPVPILIAGGGIIGLLLAVALHQYLPASSSSTKTIEIYEQAQGFDPNVGAGMNLYANGLRVIRDISPELLAQIQAAGCPYLYRQWERHDGTCVAVAEESVLGSTQNDDNSDPNAHGEQDTAEGLQTMGIGRWKLQQILHTAVAKAGIPIYFGKQVQSVETPENGLTLVTFTDQSSRQTQLLIGADGGRSVIRSTLLHNLYENSNTTICTGPKPTLSYTGVTCIMGVAENLETNSNCRRGISLPVSNTTKCHGAFFPTGANEQCFQFHFPIGEQQEATHAGCGNDGKKQDSCWGNLSQQMSREECGKLAEILHADGWDEEKYLTPLRKVTRAVRVGFCQLTPPMKAWSFPNAQGKPGAILVGDAAHPPTPYIGQGAQQGMEDVGTLALLLKTFCVDDQGQLDLTNLHHAVKLYEKIRIPRVTEIMEIGVETGRVQQKRAENPAYNIIKEE